MTFYVNCLADYSNEMSSLIFSEKEIKKNTFVSSAVVVIKIRLDVLRVPSA